MKKILYIVSLFALVFASCDPMEDIYEDVDALGIDNNVRSLDYTLTDDDYDSMGEEYGEPGNYNNFSSSIVATDFLPDFLTDKYPTLDVTSTINLTYDYYRGGIDYIKNYENLNYLQLTNDDYDSMGTASGEPGKYNNFAYNVLPEDYLPAFLAGVYDDADSGFLVEVNFKYYSNYVTSVVSQYWAYDGSVWANAALDSYTLTDDDYDSMGTDKDEPGEYGNFAYDVAVEDFLPDFLATKYPDAVANDLVDITYDYYDGSESSTLTSYFSFDGSVWSLYEAVIVVTSGVIQYDLVDDDYEEMGFDEYFDEEDNADLIATFLGQQYPYASDEDIYCVTFKYLNYNDVITRSAGQYTKTDGVWVEFASTIEKTDQYVNSTAGWVYDPSILYTMVAEDYLMIVDYVSVNVGAEYLDSYGTAEAYYGANSYYVEFNIGAGNYDSSFATWQDAVKAGVAIYLPLKYPDAVAQVDGVDVNYVITFAGYAGSMVDYTITFKCTKSGPSPEFEYVEGPTLK